MLSVRYGLRFVNEFLAGERVGIIYLLAEEPTDRKRRFWRSE